MPDPTAREAVFRGLHSTAPAPRRVAEQLLDAYRAEVLAEAATAAEALIPALQREFPEEPSNSPWACGVKDAAAEIRRRTDAAPASEGPAEMTITVHLDSHRLTEAIRDLRRDGG